MDTKEVEKFLEKQWQSLSNNPRLAVPLHKTTAPGENNRKADNADKKALFAKDKHPHPAAYHKEQWAFISDIGLRENIAYQMQYLEFLVNLYNEYQIYLTVESLLCKDILGAVGGDSRGGAV